MSRRGSEPPDLRGVLTALVTPFRAGGEVDYAALADLARWQVAGGVRGLVPCGTTGEGATLEPEEQERAVATVVAAAGGRVPVVAGCGSNDTRRTAEAARRAVGAGADAVLVVSPYYNKPNRSGMIEHYRRVCEAAAAPVVVYNVPGRTGQNLGADLILEIAAIPGVVGVKEASGSLEQLSAIVERRPPGFVVLSGDDSLAVAAIALGADGLISVVSNEAPALTSTMIEAALGGDLALARRLHYRLLPLMRANFAETSPVPVKAALEMLGRCAGDVRAPLGPPEEKTRAALRAAIERAALEDPPR